MSTIDLTVCESAHGGWTVGFPVTSTTAPGPVAHATLASLGMTTSDYPGYVVPALTPANLDSAEAVPYIDSIDPASGIITFGILRTPSADTTVRAFLRTA